MMSIDVPRWRCSEYEWKLARRIRPNSPAAEPRCHLNRLHIQPQWCSWRAHQMHCEHAKGVAAAAVAHRLQKQGQRRGSGRR